MNNVKLRALTRTDIDKTLAWHNQDEILDLYSGHPFPVNIEMEQLWYDKILTSNFPTTVFGIEVVNNHTLIGLTLLKNINLINSSAEYAIYIGDTEFRGRGFSKEATIQTLRFGFTKLGLNRIYLKVLEGNKPAFKLYCATGFKTEGIFRQSIFKNNCFLNEIAMAVLKEEFNE